MAKKGGLSVLGMEMEVDVGERTEQEVDQNINPVWKYFWIFFKKNCLKIVKNSIFKK